ncbi:hypothetical protein EON65_10570 [archaeon]|nr:MAG: hypothetical protein EON65_10570 [archaeon]
MMSVCIFLIYRWIACFQTVAHALIAVDDVRGKENQDSKKKSKRRKKKSLAQKLLEERDEAAASGSVAVDHPKTKTFIRRLSKNKRVLESLGAGGSGKGGREGDEDEGGDAEEREKALIERGLVSRPGSPGEYTDVFAQMDEQENGSPTPGGVKEASKPRAKPAEKKKPSSGDSRPGSRQKSRGSAGKEDGRGGKGEAKGKGNSDPPITEGVSADLAALFADLDESDARESGAKSDKIDKVRLSSDSRDRASFTSISKGSKSISTESRDDSLSKKGSASKSFYLEAPPQKEHLALTSGKPFTKKPSGKTSKPTSAKQKDKISSVNDITVDTTNPTSTMDPDLISPHTSPLGSDVTTGTIIAQIHDTDDPFLLSTDKSVLGVSSGSIKAPVGIAMLPLDKIGVDKGHDADDEGGYEEYGADDDFVDDDNEPSVFKHLQESTSNKTSDQPIPVPNLTPIPAPTPIIEALLPKPSLTPKHSVHQRVVANYLGKGVWYSGSIAMVRATSSTVSYDLDYDDGMKEKHISEDFVYVTNGESVDALEKVLGGKVVVHDSKHPSSAVEVEYYTQQKVMVRYKETGRWYVGKVIKQRIGERYDVLFEDGELLQAVSATNIRPCVSSSAFPKSPPVKPTASAKYKIGTLIEANRLGQGTWMSGSISRVRDSKVYDVTYESDGFEEKRVGEEQVRMLSPRTHTKQPLAALFKVDAHIEINFRALGVWYNAVVLKVRQTTPHILYDVQLDDGRSEFRVDEERIRPREMTVKASVSLVEEGSIIDLNSSQDTTGTARLAKQDNLEFSMPAERISRKCEEFDEETFESTVDNDSVAKQDKLMEEMQAENMQSHERSVVTIDKRDSKDNEEGYGQDEFYDEETSNNDHAHPVASAQLTQDVVTNSLPLVAKEEGCHVSADQSPALLTESLHAADHVTSDGGADRLLAVHQEVISTIREETQGVLLTAPKSIAMQPEEVDINPKDLAEEADEYAEEGFEEDAAVESDDLAISSVQPNHDASTSLPHAVEQSAVVGEEADVYADDEFDIAADNGDGPSNKQEEMVTMVAEVEQQVAVQHSHSDNDDISNKVAVVDPVQVGEHDTVANADIVCAPESERQAIVTPEPTHCKRIRDSHEHAKVEEVQADVHAGTAKEVFVGEHDTVAPADNMCAPESEHLAIAASEPVSSRRGRKDDGEQTQNKQRSKSDAGIPQSVSAKTYNGGDIHDEGTRKLMTLLVDDNNTVVEADSVYDNGNTSHQDESRHQEDHPMVLKQEEEGIGAKGMIADAAAGGLDVTSPLFLINVQKPVVEKEADAYVNDDLDVVAEKIGGSTKQEAQWQSAEETVVETSSNAEPTGMVQADHDDSKAPTPSNYGADTTPHDVPGAVLTKPIEDADDKYANDEFDMVDKLAELTGTVQADQVDDKLAELIGTVQADQVDDKLAELTGTVQADQVDDKLAELTGTVQADQALALEEEADAYADDVFDVVADETGDSSKQEVQVKTEEEKHFVEAGLQVESTGKAPVDQAGDKIATSYVKPPFIDASTSAHGMSEVVQKPAAVEEEAYENDEFDAVAEGSVNQEVVAAMQEEQVLETSSKTNEDTTSNKIQIESRESKIETNPSNGDEVVSGDGVMDVQADASHTVAKTSDNGNNTTSHDVEQMEKEAEPTDVLPSPSVKVANPSIANEVAAEERDLVAIVESVGVPELVSSHAYTPPLTPSESAAEKKEATIHERKARCSVIGGTSWQRSTARLGLTMLTKKRAEVHLTQPARFGAERGAPP